MAAIAQVKAAASPPTIKVKPRLARACNKGKQPAVEVEDREFSCELCAEDNVGAAQWFTIIPCQHSMCTSCIRRLAANGAEMFHCPYCKGKIGNYTGAVARTTPAWVKDSALIMQDDTTDTAVCYVCRESGFLLVCEGDGCNNGAHHK
jgi:hypothetical protein